MSADLTNNRKIQHIEIINQDSLVDRQKNYFDHIRLNHRALPEIDFNKIDSSVTFLGKKLAFPLLISSMTGGDHELVRTINRNLAIAAEDQSVALGVGSQRVMFTHPESINSFELREFAPSTLLFANIGAVQLNYGFTHDHCQKAIDVLKADALYLHLNPLQEAVQPEGDVNFENLFEQIFALSKKMDKPIILKEVGAGLSKIEIQKASSFGIKYVDVAGSGGTSWSRIENARSEATNDIGLLFQDWGIPTPLAIRDAATVANITVIGSGGVRSGIDMVKAIVLGAKLVGLAKPFLKPAMESPEKVIEKIKQIKREFETAMFLLGAENIKALYKNEQHIASANLHI